MNSDRVTEEEEEEEINKESAYGVETGGKRRGRVSSNERGRVRSDERGRGRERDREMNEQKSDNGQESHVGINKPES